MLAPGFMLPVELLMTIPVVEEKVPPVEPVIPGTVIGSEVQIAVG